MGLVAGSDPAVPSRHASSADVSLAGARRVARRHRGLITVVGSLATAALLVSLLAGRRHEFADALSRRRCGVLAVTVLLQIVALVARSEAWHLSIEAAGGTVERRVLYRASSMQVLGSVVNGHLGVGRADRRAPPLVAGGQPAGADAGRRGVPDPRRSRRRWPR